MSQKHDVQLSKSLSWLLRHGASKESLTLDDAGFIDVQKILSLKQFKKYNNDDILRVVNNNDKKRFTLRVNDSNILQIRANQGHSIPVEEKQLLTLLNENTVPPLLYHGTYMSYLNSINEKGLSRMNRNHIHFTAKLPGEGEVISGMRKNCDAVVVINALKAMQDGFKFYISDNNVILSPGNETGVIPATYFKEILH